jgi:hypothetical protein
MQLPNGHYKIIVVNFDGWAIWNRIKEDPKLMKMFNNQLDGIVASEAKKNENNQYFDEYACHEQKYSNCRQGFIGEVFVHERKGWVWAKQKFPDNKDMTFHDLIDEFNQLCEVKTYTSSSDINKTIKSLQERWENIIKNKKDIKTWVLIELGYPGYIGKRLIVGNKNGVLNFIDKEIERLTNSDIPY